EVGQHGLEHTRIERRRRLVVEIDRLRARALCQSCNGHAHAALAAPARGLARRYIAVHASRKCSISASLVLQLRLTRIVEAAISAEAPIPSKTWLGPTLPEEQAAPALTMTPSRSRAMTCVSAETPGSAIALVLGRRGAVDPMTIASGAIARILASSAFRRLVTRSSARLA